MLRGTAARSLDIVTFATGPIQHMIIPSRCITHQYCNDKALAAYQESGFNDEAKFLKAFYSQLQLGVVWADQNWQNIHHFLDPNTRRGVWQFSNAAFQYISHYKMAVKYLRRGYLDKAVFYLGAAAHLVQDMCVPHHAKCKLFDGHKQYEDWVERNYLKIPMLVSYESSVNNPLYDMFSNAAVALDFYDYVTYGAGEEKFRMATEILLPLAQKSTILLFMYFIEQAKSSTSFLYMIERGLPAIA